MTTTRDAADLERRARPEFEPQPGIDAATPNADAVGQCRYRGRRGVRLGEVVGLRPIELRLEARPDASPVRLGREIGIVEDTEQRALDAGLVKCTQQKDRVAASAAAWVVGDIGKGKRR